MDLAFLDKEANLRKASEMVREAAANGASLICLPEAFNTGYLGSDIPAMKKMAEPLEGESVTVMRNWRRSCRFIWLPRLFMRQQTVRLKIRQC